jgi:hypothetical protein
MGELKRLAHSLALERERQSRRPIASGFSAMDESLDAILG